MTDQLPAIIPPGALTTTSDTYIVPSLIAAAGDAAGWRFVEFFTANINNDHTRRAYARACGRFFGWCERRGLTLAAIRPVHVAGWVKELQTEHSAPGVKQQLAAVRMLFDWLVTGQVVPMNPAAVRGPTRGAWCAVARRRREFSRRSAITRFARLASRRISPMAARSNTRRRWQPTRARARPSYTTGRRSGSHRMKWRR
jgi:hypothetical protein